MWLGILVSVVGMTGAVALIWFLAVRAIRWVRAHRGEAATAVAEGMFLPQFPPHDGAIERARDWLGEKLDAITDPPSAAPSGDARESDGDGDSGGGSGD